MNCSAIGWSELVQGHDGRTFRRHGSRSGPRIRDHTSADEKPTLGVTARVYERNRRRHVCIQLTQNQRFHNHGSHVSRD